MKDLIIQSFNVAGEAGINNFWMEIDNLAKPMQSLQSDPGTAVSLQAKLLCKMCSL